MSYERAVAAEKWLYANGFERVCAHWEKGDIWADVYFNTIAFKNMKTNENVRVWNGADFNEAIAKVML